MSIHRLSYRIIGLLDRMIFFFSPRNLSLFFAGFGYPIPENENQTEFALDLIREFEEAPGGTNNLVGFKRSRQNLMRSRNGGDEQDQHGLSLKEAISSASIDFQREGCVWRF
ncbi:ABC TRANSPORTER G FAMILY MEMBER 28 [Salix koriyanagi]|uniref:ABC TRANSPORTER G FAMILY MEMBER 28 n=1 Tax=Salix koriyanagi TaxID=2511006 RepID=A0A9Q0WW93_9ROSI|nr:ABC TRANSPORTER G FAMILY MEMBER 28 [Salix koriyanagi]